MVFMTFPAELTEEELMLQTKYQKLRKKKKALTTLKAPKTEPEAPIIVQRKRPLEGKDAKEIAKKLILSGKISAIQKREEKTTFKRSHVLERKLSGVEHRPKIGSGVGSSPPYATPRPNAPPLPPIGGASPAAATPAGNRNRNRKRKGFDGNRRSGPSIPLDMDAAVDVPIPGPTPSKKAIQDPKPSPNSKRRTGNTIYVFGYNITEDILRRAFANFGAILSVSTEAEKNCGFVTFARPEMAEAAIAEMNGSMFADVQLRVSLARRQPILDPEALAAANSSKELPGVGAESWSAIAAAQGQRGPPAPVPVHHAKREQVAYDDDIF